ncbi:MAG: hypothetical protein R3Y26_02700 [Rikenellaceae bacterium]
MANYKLKTKHILSHLKSPQFWICISLAMIFWVFNRLNNEFTTNIKIPVVMRGVSENNKIENNTTLDVDVKIKSSGYKVFYYKYVVPKTYFSVSIADVDMVRSVDSLYFNLSIPMLEDALRKYMGVNEELIAIQNRHINVGAKHYRQKTVPIYANASIDLGGKLMQIGKLKLTPARVTVGGTSTIIDTLQYVNTEPIVINIKNKNFIGSVNLVRNPHLEYSTDEIYYTLKTEEYCEVKEEFRVWIEGDNKDNLILLPQKVTLTLNVPKNSYFTFDKNLFRVYVDYDEASKSNKYLVKYSSSIDNIKVTDIEPKYVTIFKTL